MKGRPRKKNRRKEGNGVQVHAPSMALLVFASSVFIGYLWLCGQCENLGTRIKNAEAEFEALRRRVLTEEYKWEQMKHAGNIQLFLERHRLQMDWPDDNHILLIPVDPAGALAELESSGPLQLVRSIAQ